MSINLILTRNGAKVGSVSVDESVEIGRRDKNEINGSLPMLSRNDGKMLRCVVADLELIKVPRLSVRLDPIEGNRWRITNVHKNVSVSVQGSGELVSNESRILEIPALIQLPEGLSIAVRTDFEDPFQGGVSALIGPSKLGADPGSGNNFQMTLARLTMDGGAASQVDLPVVLDWMEQAMAAMQRPVTSATFFSGIAQTVAKIIDLDRAEVVLWDGSQWDFDASRRYVNPRVTEQSLRAPSNTLLKQVLATKQIVIHPDPAGRTDLRTSKSVQMLHTAVACPILDILEGGKEILGVLYADRSLNIARRLGTVKEPEKKLIAILATAIASSIARMKREALVTKYQQFFSSKVSEAISLNPGLLKGEDIEVTVLFCDIRGFSRVTDLIGPQAAMTWVSDTLSELSEIVLQSNGVLVDYVGDEMFAMWGAPDKSADHASRAAMAASEMMELRAVLSERYKESIPGGVDYGIGICTGPARVGNTGSKQKFKYGPMGTTVNLGSRIQGLTKQWNVSALMDAATADSLPPELLKRRLAKAVVVGLDGATDLYELMPSNLHNGAELATEYATALDLYETGQHFREAARAFGELVQRFPTDGPSLVMLARAVNELIDPSKDFSPVWRAKNK